MYKVCLVGAGSIGGNKPDEVDFEGGPVLTHAHAISENPDLEPYMVVDRDSAVANVVFGKWGFYAHRGSTSDAWDMFDINGFPEVVVIAAPANAVRAIFDIFSPEIEIVILEKPGGDSKEDLTLLAEMAKNTGTEVLLNYQRQYLPLYNYKEIADRIGAVHQITCRYTRGTIRDGSHFIAFLVKFFGMEIQVNNIKQLNTIPDLGKGT